MVVIRSLLCNPRIQLRHNNYMRVREHAHLIHVHVHVPTHIYIADMRTKEISKCTVTSEGSVFSYNPLVSVVWGLSVVGGIGGKQMTL